MMEATHEKYSRPDRFLGGYAARAGIGGAGGKIVRRGNPLSAREGTERRRLTQRVWLRSGGDARTHADVEPPDCRASLAASSYRRARQGKVDRLAKGNRANRGASNAARSRWRRCRRNSAHRRCD